MSRLRRWFLMSPYMVAGWTLLAAALPFVLAVMFVSFVLPLVGYAVLSATHLGESLVLRGREISVMSRVATALRARGKTDAAEIAERIVDGRLP